MKYIETRYSGVIFGIIITLVIGICLIAVFKPNIVLPTWAEEPWCMGTVIRVDVGDSHQLICVGSRDYLYTVKFDEGGSGQYRHDFAYVQRFHVGDKVALKYPYYNTGIFQYAKLVEVES